MISLEKQSGLPITFDPETLALTFSADVAVGDVTERAFADMQRFIADPEARASRDPIYRVWRHVNRKTDAERIERVTLRYDLTLIAPGKFVSNLPRTELARARGSPHAEFFRTAGHYHERKPEHRLPLPEVYEVLYGRAYWIIQRPDPSDSSRLEEIYTIEAGPGEKAIMLPGFGHVSVNTFSDPLLMANWIDDTFEYDYAPYLRLRGAGYWVTEGPMPETTEFERNINYAAVPELKKLRPNDLPEFGLIRSRPAYALAAELEKLRFLSQPEEFTHSLTLDHCYRPVV